LYVDFWKFNFKLLSVTIWKLKLGILHHLIEYNDIFIYYLTISSFRQFKTSM